MVFSGDSYEARLVDVLQNDITRTFALITVHLGRRRTPAAGSQEPK